MDEKFETETKEMSEDIRGQESPAELCEEAKVSETEAEVTLKATLPPLRKAVNRVFLWLLIYNLIISVVGSIFIFANTENGIESLAGTLLGAAALIIFTRKKWPVRFNGDRRKMTGRDFFFYLCLIGLFQSLTVLIMTAVEAAGVSGTYLDPGMITVPFIIYAAIAGPFCEEVAYRGFAAGNLKQYGKVFGIVLSALAFGLMHMNATQFVVGTLAGLLLGYIYAEYSLLWALIFHVINNFGLTLLPQLLFPNVPMETLNMCILIFVYVLGAIGVFLIIKRRKAIKAYFTAPENRAPKGSFWKVVSSPWFIIFVLIYAAYIVLFMMYPELTNPAAFGEAMMPAA